MSSFLRTLEGIAATGLIVTSTAVVVRKAEAEPRPPLVVAHTNLPGPEGTGNCRKVVVPDGVVDQNLYWLGSCANGWGGRKAPKFTLMTTEGRTLEEACKEDPDGIYPTWVRGSSGPAMPAVCPQPDRHDLSSVRTWRRLIGK